MRYSNETHQFWKLGWIMFGKRFVNYIGGLKSHGDTVLKMADRGYYDPQMHLMFPQQAITCFEMAHLPVDQ